jgi:ribokinase
MKILNFGSMNIDYVYRVEHFVRPGETLGAISMEKQCGGKGLNQSTAAARAGAEVYHAGMAGVGSEMLVSMLKDNGVDVSCVCGCAQPAGHAVIQVNPRGQNSILVYSGSNHAFGREYIEKTLAKFAQGDIVLLQNEINNVPYIMEKAAEKKLRVIFNPSPAGEEILGYPLESVGLFILNETEAKMLTDENEPERAAKVLRRRCPGAAVLLTLGEKGGIYSDSEREETFDAFSVAAVDTTGAGDTFTGYFIAGIAQGLDTGENLRRAAAASALAVSKKGAAASIPVLAQTLAFLARESRK